MLDEIDRAIISYLQYDGRTPFTQIAEHLNISEGAVRRRVKNLIDSGLMQVVAIVEPQSMGLDEGVLIGINVQANMTEEVADAVAKLPEVSYLFQAAGEFDLFAEVFCKDRNHFVSFLNTKLQKIPLITRCRRHLLHFVDWIAQGHKGNPPCVK